MHVHGWMGRGGAQGAPAAVVSRQVCCAYIFKYIHQSNHLTNQPQSPKNSGPSASTAGSASASEGGMEVMGGAGGSGGGREVQLVAEKGTKVGCVYWSVWVVIVV